MVVGLGIASDDVKPDSWTRVYGCVTGVYTGDEQEALTALRLYQKKQLRHHTAAQDEMIMLNTWGDRSQDAKIDEAFCLAEAGSCRTSGCHPLSTGRWLAERKKVPTQKDSRRQLLKIFGKMPITGRPTPRNSLMD